jgi:hypothetical protein
MRMKNKTRTMFASDQARTRGLREIAFRTTKNGERVVRGPENKIKPGPVTAREWGRDVPVVVTRVGATFEVKGVKLCYGYLETEETPGHGGA